MKLIAWILKGIYWLLVLPYRVCLALALRMAYRVLYGTPKVTVIKTSDSEMSGHRGVGSRDSKGMP